MREWVKGFVKVTVLGGMPEQFLNMASEMNIELWDTQRQDITLTFCCIADDYRHLRPLARRCGARMRAGKRIGFPFLIRPIRKRWGLAVGVLMAIVMVSILSSRIWMISVSGNQRVADDEILSVLRPLGVVTGGNFDTVDIPTVKLVALQQLSDIRWLSVSQHGSHVFVQVKEREPTAPLADTAPANIVSTCDGVVVDVHVVDGTAAVKVGDAVTTDTLLISGVTESAVGPILRRAQGEILARTTVVLSATVPLKEQRLVSNPTTYQKHTILFFGWEIPWSGTVPSAEGHTLDERVQYLSAKGKTLPIGILTSTYRVRETETVVRTEQQAKEEAYRQLVQLTAATEQTMVVEKRQVTYKVENGMVTAVGTYTGTRSIGVLRPIG